MRHKVQKLGTRLLVLVNRGCASMCVLPVMRWTGSRPLVYQEAGEGLTNGQVAREGLPLLIRIGPFLPDVGTSRTQWVAESKAPNNDWVAVIRTGPES
ncbi:hypothetical protein V8F33_012841 [Rhypophila sp. PSN 637]